MSLDSDFNVAVGSELSYSHFALKSRVADPDPGGFGPDPTVNKNKSNEQESFNFRIGTNSLIFFPHFYMATRCCLQL